MNKIWEVYRRLLLRAAACDYAGSVARAADRKRDAPLLRRRSLHRACTPASLIGPTRATWASASTAPRESARSRTGGQVLLSRSTAGIIDDYEISGVTVRDLGEHSLKDIDRPERVFEVVVEGLPTDFPRHGRSTSRRLFRAR